MAGSWPRSLILAIVAALVTIRQCVAVSLRGPQPADNASLAGLTAFGPFRGALNSTVNFVHAFSNATATGGADARKQRAPRVYFLFLASDKISNLDVWKAFFATAPQQQYRAFVHCKMPSCQQQVAGSVITAVPTVPSYYCTDLVSPMQQMVNYALQDYDGPPNPFDKFAFVSDSSLPAKPFWHVYNALSMRAGSDFCVFPAAEWADVSSASGGGLEIAVKSHQWVTLNRAHAEKSWNLWKTGTLHNFMSYFRMNYLPMQPNNNSFADSRNYGCLDEFWYMLALFGTLHQPQAHREQDVHLSMFTGGLLRISAQAGWQGECDTFVLWSKYLYTWGNNPFQRMHSSLDPASVPHNGNFARPGWWDTISTHGMQAIRGSSFLFVRKFIDNPRLADGPNFAQAYIATVLH